MLIPVLALLLGSVVLLPIGMGIIARKRLYSIPVFVFIGLLLGLGVYMLGIVTNNSQNRFMSIFMGMWMVFSSIAGYVLFITSLCIRAKPKPEPQVTLAIPLPPGQGE